MVVSNSSSHRGGGGHGRPQEQPAAEQLSSDERACVERLWRVHCSAIADTVRVTDNIVEDVWQRFRVLLQQHTSLVPIECSALCPRSAASALPSIATCISDSDEASGQVPYTHVFTLDVPPASSVHDNNNNNGSAVASLSSATAEEASTTATAMLSPHTPHFTAEMRAALMEQPTIVLCLLEFFAAVLYEQERRRQHNNSNNNDSSSSSAAAPVGRVYCLLRAEAARAVSFEHVGAAQLGTLLTLRGTVVRLGPPRILCLALTYKCDRCGATQRAATPDGVLVYPGPCSGRCRGYRWLPVTSQSVYEEVQQLKLQEHVDFFDASLSELGGGGGGGGGGMNKVMEVELRQPLIDHVTVGDTVCVCGVLTCRRGDRKAGGAQQLCLHARAITSTSAHAQHAALRRPAHLTAMTGEAWTADESAAFYEMARHPQWFARLSASVAPSLYGLQMVKEAVLLAVVGGTTQKLSTRSSIHLLLLGNPGLGKSQLLRAACAVAPRSAYVCAHTSSSCGLTITLARDPVSGEATFASGAVVHGDGGVTCIDEIDKGVSEHKALLEVMEQETVSIAKAGMIFSMPVHTAVLAAGNPTGGRFDLSKPISANTNLSPALLSRFDIVVCLHDPHAHSSEQLTSYVLQLHRRPQREQATTAATATNAGAATRGGGNNNSSSSHSGSGGAGLLPHELVQRFIVFCKSQCQPMLRAEACEILKAHYLDERVKRAAAAAAGGNFRAHAPCMEVAVTPRYLQALIRVAEARAKVELRHEVTSEDAHYAVQLLQSCQRTLDRVAHHSAASLGGGGGGGGGSRKKSQRDYVVDVLKAEVVREGGVNRLSHKTILAACEEAGCKNPHAMLQQLNEYGILLQCGDKYALHDV